MARQRKPRPGELRIDTEGNTAFATYEYTENAKDQHASMLRAMGRYSRFRVDPTNLEIYDPPDQARVGPSGSWIMITRKLPPIEHHLDEHFRVGRILWAERSKGCDVNGFLKGGVYKILCPSPWGEVHLWPYEYRTLDASVIIEMWTAGEIVFHPTRIDDARFTEIAFYARSRGIGLGEAAVMALGQLSGPVGWFEPTEELAAACQAMERRVNCWSGIR